MVQKRLLSDEYDVSPKHPRLEQSYELVSFSEFPLNDSCGKRCTLGEAEGCFSEHVTDVGTKFRSGKISDFPIFTANDHEDIPSGNISTSSWAGSVTSEDDMRTEEQICISYSPEQSPIKPRRILCQPEDAYSYLFDHPPLKEIPVGPEFQADIPEWRGCHAKNPSTGTVDALFPSSHPYGTNCMGNVDDEFRLVGSCDDEFRLVGSCVIAVPEVDPSSCEKDVVGRGRTDCLCEIPGSIRCVHHHIDEAREKLRTTLGLETFIELGFDDMGDIVAEKWSEEDEQLFHEIVYSNPVSSGRNFWDHLAAVFPSRTTQEIVSYYFNVFMLQRRAEQNRHDPLNIDSDNDEWQGRYESEEDEDSSRDEIHENDSYEHNGEIENPVFDYYKEIDFQGFKGITNVSETCPKDLLNSFNSTSHPSEKFCVDEDGGDSKEDSCTSSDTGDAPQVGRASVDGRPSPWGTHDFLLEPSDSKPWDIGYLPCPRNKADFLPTGSMIEEVFGVGSWNFKGGDDKSLY